MGQLLVLDSREHTYTHTHLSVSSLIAVAEDAGDWRGEAAVGSWSLPRGMQDVTEVVELVSSVL